jgi:formate hydrogenlyase subunit 3/multisubunit Na+/H+ antiporter MnhD subunit
MAAPAAALAMLILAFVPGRIRGMLAVLAAAAAAWWIWPRTAGIDRIFAMLFLGGGALNMFAGLYRSDRRAGFWAFSLMTVLALGALTLAVTPLELFMAWEFVSVGAVLIVLQGRRAAGPSRSGMLFALGGGYLLMIVLASGAAGGPIPPFFAAVLAAMAFLAKSGSLGLHIWLPGGYAEADDDASSLLSSVIGKAGIFAMIIFSLRVLPQMYGLDGPELWLNAFSEGPFSFLSQILGWIGVLTAFAATLIAVFQEDIKYTLAWSSIGQVGYIVLAFSLFSHFGWTTAIYLSLNHFLFKSMLFLAVAGIVHRVKTRQMYKMGGLIVPMPISFISVLMAIIALSGVPPLSGFGGKWMVYSALIESDRYLQAALAMFTSGIAFLYLFRLIHSIFLGQRKDDSLGIREAPAWIILPQVVLIAILMAISAFPKIILDPLISAVGQWMPASIAFENSTLISALGYWNGSWVMYVTMGVFIVPLLMLLIGMRNVQKVKQFNIVFAAERPYRPETTHYAHNFFAPYRKALGFLLKPAGRRFWEGTVAGVQAVSSSFRRIYTGNGQTYALHIVLFTMAVALFSGVFS